MAEASNQAATNGSANAQWAVARKYAEGLGFVPSSFTVAVRAMIADHFGNNAALRPVTKYQVARLMRGPTFLALLYYATRELKGETLKDQQSWSVGSMLDVFKPLDIASLVASFVFFRKCRRLLGDERWKLLRDSLVLDVQLASQVGAAVDAIGIGYSIISSSWLHYASGAVFVAKEKEFKEYYRQIEKNFVKRDVAQEASRFGCSISQVAILLLSTFGFGTEIANALSIATDPENTPYNISEDLPRSLMVVHEWLAALRAGKEQPSPRLPAKYFPLAADLPLLSRKIKNVLAGNQVFLERGKKDVSPELTPELFVKEAANPEIPEQLKDVFSMDDISKMEEEDFDDLIDQIDAEQEGKTPPGSVVLKEKDLKDLEEMVS